MISLRQAGGTLAALALILGFAIPPAQACSILPPPAAPAPRPGVSPADAASLAQAWDTVQRTRVLNEDRERTLALQADFFARSASLLLARIEGRDRISGLTGPGAYLNGLPQVSLRPVQWLKGGGRSDEAFLLSAQPFPSCGSLPGHDALRGEPGDLFVIYLSGDTARQQDVLGTVALGALIEPQALSAILAAQQ